MTYESHGRIRRLLSTLARSGLVGAALVAAIDMVSQATAHPTYEDAHQRGGGLAEELDRNEYLDNVEVVTTYWPGEDRGSKMQMMAVGERRFIFQSGRVLDVTDPLNATEVSRGGFQGGQVTMAYSESAGKWIMMTSAQNRPYSSSTLDADPDAPGLRGIRIYDVSDPENIVHLANYSTDTGNPNRLVQEGSGTHRNYWDGGRYAYLDTQMDNSYSNTDQTRANGVQIIDMEDPSNPKFVSYWHVPGQHESESAIYRQLEWAGDGQTWSSFHGPFYVPTRVEDGGRYAYSGWGAYGFKIHDVSDVLNPKEVGAWTFDRKYYASVDIPMHGVNIQFLDRDIVISNSETRMPHCTQRWTDSYVFDVSDPTDPQVISTLPIPTPPEDAPYDDFCDKRGRFGPHNMPHHKAPGQPHPDITAYAFFNAGIQFYDLSNPRDPEIVGYYIPAQGGDIDDIESYFRDTDAVFIEWDRRLVWVGTYIGLVLLSTPLLGEPVFEPVPVTEWSMPAVNVGFEEFDD